MVINSHLYNSRVKLFRWDERRTSSATVLGLENSVVLPLETDPTQFCLFVCLFVCLLDCLFVCLLVFSGLESTQLCSDWVFPKNGGKWENFYFWVLFKKVILFSRQISFRLTGPTFQKFQFCLFFWSYENARMSPTCHFSCWTWLLK